MAKQPKRDWYPIGAVADQMRAKSDGVNDGYWLTTESYSKANSDESPYCVANEWICGRIAQYLCLPIAPFAILKPPRQRPYFASLGMTPNRMAPENGEPAVCMERFPDTCTGVLVFDILIANSDRQYRNVKVDTPGDPTWMRILDHERALLGCMPKDGKALLGSLWRRLGVSGGAVSLGTRHIYLDLVDNSELLFKWVLRVKSIPEWYIDHACEYAESTGINKSEQKAAARFLKYRKQHIDSLIVEHKDHFTGMKFWGYLFQ
jgi:hypothetical protein